MPVLVCGLMTGTSQGWAAETKRKANLKPFCCIESSILFCRSLLWCNPFSGRYQDTQSKPDRLTLRSVLMYDRAFLLGRIELHGDWMPATSLPKTLAAIAEPTISISTRAGLISDNEVEPEFPTIKQGTATWTPVQIDDAKSIRVTVRIDGGRLRVDLVFAVDSNTRLFVIDLAAEETSGSGPWLPMEMPRARRAGATEGEPLHGRIANSANGTPQVELSRDPVDLANNQRRILGAPWLDFRFTDRHDKTLVVTIEKGRASTEMLANLLKDVTAEAR